MLKALYTAATGMHTQQTQVDILANNLANVNTTGFKRSDATFEDLLYVTQTTPGAATKSGTTVPGLQIGSGSTLVGTSKNFSSGALVQTQQPFDLAVNGPGFFELKGVDGGRVFTRAGAFAADRDGSLVNPEGLKLVNGPSNVANATQVNISIDGKVTGLVNGVQTDLGQIQLVTFPNPPGLEALGGNTYRETVASGAAVIATPGSNGSGTVRQGYLERSNVDIATELINLILAQRAYETNSRAISTADQMLNTANQVTR